MVLQHPATSQILKAPTKSAASIDSVPVVDIEGIPIDAFPDWKSFFDRIVYEIRKPGQALIGNLNVYAANIAFENPRFKKFVKDSDMIFCDGAGIVLASRILKGEKIPTYVTAAEYLPALLERLAHEKLTVYFLGWEPGIADKAMEVILPKVPNHTVAGWHHGYIHSDPKLEQEVIATINAIAPDLLIVGFGMPLQEFWLDEKRHLLKAGAVMPLGAVLDYFSKKVPRCSPWVKRIGMAWLFRFCVEPRRMFNRYIIGNPWFLSRIILRSICQRILPSN